MKGVILAGGTGSRLSPLTDVTNKHLLPVYNKPMIYYPIECMVAAGIEEVLLVTGGNNAGEFVRLLGDGRKLGLKELHYTYQEKPGGIAQALGLAEHFVGDDRFCLILGDNIVEYSIKRIAQFYQSCGAGAGILLSKVDNPKAYGIADFKRGSDSLVKRIIEKPTNPPSSLAVIGIYFYDPSVFDVIKTLKPSARGELEITDVNNYYISKDQLIAQPLVGFWADAGENIDFYLRACNMVAERGANKEL